MRILLDNGHGATTKGKRSPDGRLLEYKWTREIASMVERILTLKGYDCQRIVATDEDVPLAKRVAIVNSHVAKLGASNVCLVSIHVDASGAGQQWMKAHGWSVFVAQNASDKSKRLATCIFQQAKGRGWCVRQQYPNLGYWVKSLAMCRDTKCPAVLCENFFMDNQSDCDFISKHENKQAIAQAIADGIQNYCNGI